MSFHRREGFFFARLEDGSVKITVRFSSRQGSPVFRELVVPENEWASAVAAVCARGETAETWREARDFHGRSA